MKYPNIKAEMARYGLSGTSIADSLGISMSSFSLKVNGKRDWTVSEAVKLVSLFSELSGSEVSMDYLFLNRQPALTAR